jgi:hypothetical protein
LEAEANTAGQSPYSGAHQRLEFARLTESQFRASKVPAFRVAMREALI